MIYSSGLAPFPICPASAQHESHPRSLSLLGTCGKEDSGRWWSHPRLEGDPGVKPAGGGIGAVLESTINTAFVLFMCSFPPSLISLLVESSWVQSHRGERPFHQVGPILFCFCSSQDLVVFHLNYALCISGWRAHNLWRSLSYKPTLSWKKQLYCRTVLLPGMAMCAYTYMWLSLVCICVLCVHTCMIHVCVYLCVLYIWADMNMYVYVWCCTWVCACMPVCIHVCMCCACVSVCACFMYLCMYVCVHMYRRWCKQWYLLSHWTFPLGKPEIVWVHWAFSHITN